MKALMVLVLLFAGYLAGYADGRQHVTQAMETPQIWTLVDPATGGTFAHLEQASCEKQLLLGSNMAYCVNEDTGQVVQKPPTQ